MKLIIAGCIGGIIGSAITSIIASKILSKKIEDIKTYIYKEIDEIYTDWMKRRERRR